MTAVYMLELEIEKLKADLAEAQGKRDWWLASYEKTWSERDALAARLAEAREAWAQVMESLEALTMLEPGITFDGPAIVRMNAAIGSATSGATESSNE